ncbi:MAG TPA: prepilin-type cleavage/methylation domain-containing protein [Burkholderiaceae bacterium]
MKIPASPRPAAGYTLVELSVIVLLVGILTAIALPFYNSYRDRIRVSHAIMSIQAMEASIDFYRTQNGALPGSLADMQLQGSLDPWGNPYVYYNIQVNGKGHARKDHALNPLNTDYDLYSAGADGQTKSQITQKDSVDDVIRASNGAFVGLASDF